MGIQEEYEEKQKLLIKASNNAGILVLFGVIFGITLSYINNIFEYIIINHLINLAIGALLYFVLYHAVNKKNVFPYYSEMSYFHFYITSYIFGQIIQWTIVSLIYDQQIEYISFKIFLLNNIIFHLGEFYFVCFYYPKDLKWKSFLINHSPGYNAAFACALLEYGLGCIFPNFFYFFFQNKIILIILGSLMAIFGHFFRIGAQQTAKIQYQKQENHQLVKSGVYAISRHPSYLGFFSYSLGGQLILGNIFCFFAYTYVLFKFFLDRIVEEEYYLVKFFGEEYTNYRNTVPIGIPFLEYAINKKYVYED